MNTRREMKKAGARRFAVSGAGVFRCVLPLLSLTGLVIILAYAVYQRPQRFEGYYTLLAVQLLLALFLLSIVTLGLSCAQSSLRWLVCRWRRGEAPQWEWISPEGVTIATILVGLWLISPTRQTVINPAGHERIEFRYPSLMEGPLGLNACSDVSCR